MWNLLTIGSLELRISSDSFAGLPALGRGHGGDWLTRCSEYAKSENGGLFLRDSQLGCPGDPQFSPLPLHTAKARLYKWDSS